MGGEGGEGGGGGLYNIVLPNIFQCIDIIGYGKEILLFLLISYILCMWKDERKA